MHRFVFSLALALLLVIGRGVGAEAATDSAAPKAAPVDERLAQKVTYKGGYKRLHQVVSDISSKTGVSIFCGKNNGDWPVRDLPLALCVSDVSLGKLLRVLADTTHLQYASKKTSLQKDNERTYRIYRTAEQEEEIGALLWGRSQAQLALADWSWEALVKLGKLPKDVDVPKETKLLAKILAALPPDTKKRVFDGEQITLRGEGNAQAGLIHSLYHWAWEDTKEHLDDDSVMTAPAPNQQDLERATLDIRLMDPYGETDRTGIEFCLSPICYNYVPGVGGGISSQWVSMASHTADGLDQIKELDLPPKPESGNPPRPKDDMADKGFTLLSRSSDEDWQRPLLQARVKLEMPEDNPNPTLADLLVRLSQASGFSIICEDFVSQRRAPPTGDIRSFFDAERTLAGIIRDLSDYQTWFIDEENKILVGWAEEWRDRHACMVSADYLNNLRTKLDGVGVQLDDVTAFAGMTQGQFSDWIFTSRDFGVLEQGRTYDAGVWKLYDMLNPEDKARAKSGSGLQLANLDTVWVGEFFRQQRLNRTVGTSRSPYEDDEKKRDSKEQQKYEILSNPKLIPSLVMRIKSERAQGRFVNFVHEGRESVEFRFFPESSNLQKYSMELTGEDEQGEKFTLTFRGPGLAFPVYSAKREAELAAKAVGPE